MSGLAGPGRPAASASLVDLAATAIAPTRRLVVAAEAVTALAPDLPLPWRPRPGVRDLGAVLDPAPPDSASARLPRATADRVRSALALAATAPVRVDIDLALRRDGRRVGLRSWHRHHGTGFVALSTTGGRTVEIAVGDAECWSAELTRAATIDTGPVADDRDPPEVITVAWELLAAGGAALRSGRGDAFERLLDDHGDRVCADGTPQSRGRAADLVRRLHDRSRGHLRAVVTTAHPLGPRVGLVVWSLHPEGWRQLQPCVDGEPRVRLPRRRPDDLPADLAPLLARPEALSPCGAER